MTEVLQVHDKLVMMKNCFLRMSKEGGAEMESASDKDAVEIADMTVRGNITKPDGVGARSERPDSF